MKKLVLFFAVASVVLVFGCGPRRASLATLNALSSAKSAAESAEVKLKELEKERITLEGEKTEKEEMMKNLEQELEALKRGVGEGGE